MTSLCTQREDAPLDVQVVWELHACSFLIWHETQDINNAQKGLFGYRNDIIVVESVSTEEKEKVVP